MNLFEFASSHGAQMLPAIKEDEITKYEERTHLRLPNGLREFYLKSGGTNEFTGLGWRIWPFGELTTIERKTRSIPDIEHLDHHTCCPDLSKYIAFIDVLIEAPLYATCADPADPLFGEVVLFSGDSDPFLAGPIQTFEEFETILSIHWEDIILPDSISEQGAAANP